MSGESIEWETPDGDSLRMTVVERREIEIRDLYRAHRSEVERILEDDEIEGPLAVDEVPGEIVVRAVTVDRRTSYVIEDGFHRIAGLLAGGVETWPVVVVTK